MPNASYNSRVVRPVECLTSGFEMIKGQYWLILGITAVGVLIAGLVPLGILMGPMMCGIYLVLLERIQGRTVKFELLFKGFNYFVESLIATVILFAVTIIFLVPLFGSAVLVCLAVFPKHGGRINESPAGVIAWVAIIGFGVLICIAIAMAIGVLFTFTYPLIVDRRMPGWEAVKLSIKAALANFWSLLGLAILNALLGIVGVIACYFGSFLVLPITFASHAMAYRQVFGIAGSQPLAPPPAQ